MIDAPLRWAATQVTACKPASRLKADGDCVDDIAAVIPPNRPNRSHRVRVPPRPPARVVYVDYGARWTPQERAPSTAGTPARGEELHVCTSCASKLMHPVDWQELVPGRWSLLLRCPNCAIRRKGVFGTAAIERLDDELDRAASELLSDLKRITHRNMAEETELLVRALELDLIDAADFAPR
jgi:hypothetical protein